ncbi:MAG: hypothetical protein HYV07_04465 [Deltaproteobacteria bacterium]|nr:hypothetical protein [Deltaproteobacteria bacterium]
MSAREDSSTRADLPSPLDSQLPGADLVSRGLLDLKDGRRTIESLLVSIGRSRLARLGFSIEEWTDAESPEMTLYQMLAAEGAAEAHSRYNALIRRLVSFERAKELELFGEK